MALKPGSHSHPGKREMALGNGTDIVRQCMRFERNTIRSRIDGTWREWHGNLRKTDIIFSKEKDANGHKEQ